MPGGGPCPDTATTRVGTGFLVAGSDLHPDLPPLVLITNGHVVPEGLNPVEAVVAFHGLDDDPGPSGPFRVAHQWWYRPSSRQRAGHRHPRAGRPIRHGVSPCRSPRRCRPSRLRNRRAYVIGHPRGLTQPQFSLQDNLLLDYDQRVVHYRSPTEREAPAARFSTIIGN